MEHSGGGGCDHVMGQNALLDIEAETVLKPNYKSDHGVRILFNFPTSARSGITR